MTSPAIRFSRMADCAVLTQSARVSASFRQGMTTLSSISWESRLGSIVRLVIGSLPESSPYFAVRRKKTILPSSDCELPAVRDYAI